MPKVGLGFNRLEIPLAEFTSSGSPGDSPNGTAAQEGMVIPDGSGGFWSCTASAPDSTWVHLSTGGGGSPEFTVRTVTFEDSDDDQNFDLGTGFNLCLIDTPWGSFSIVPASPNAGDQLLVIKTNDDAGANQ